MEAHKKLYVLRQIGDELDSKDGEFIAYRPKDMFPICSGWCSVPTLKGAIIDSYEVMNSIKESLIYDKRNESTEWEFIEVGIIETVDVKQMKKLHLYNVVDNSFIKTIEYNPYYYPYTTYKVHDYIKLEDVIDLPCDEYPYPLWFGEIKQMVMIDDEYNAYIEVWGDWK